MLRRYNIRTDLKRRVDPYTNLVLWGLTVHRKGDSHDYEVFDSLLISGR